MEYDYKSNDTVLANNNDINLNKKDVLLKNNNFLIKKFSLFDSKLNKEIFENVTDVVENFQEDEFELEKLKKLDKKEFLESSISSDNQHYINKLEISELKYFCTTCDYSFLSRDDQKEHFKCDLHLFNLKQKLKNKPPVNQEEFEQLTDISSISGSDYEETKSLSSTSLDEDEKMSEAQKSNKVIKNNPKIIFKLGDNTVINMYRCLLYNKRNQPKSILELLQNLKAIPFDDQWCIILVGAGHFAAAIFKNNKVIVHKTFHRYVVRAKRGTLQSQHDSSGKHAKSAGACIRRNMEQAFKEEIRILIANDWKDELNKCNLIFIRVPHYNRSLLISSSKNSSSSTDSTFFNRDDPRLRNIPFMTFRPTFNEVKRVHGILSTIEHYNSFYIDFTQKYEKNLVESLKTIKIKSEPSNLNKTKSKKKNKNYQKESSESDEDSSLKQKETLFFEKEVDENLIKHEIHTNKDDFIQSLDNESLSLFNSIYSALIINDSFKLENILSSIKESISVKNLINKRLNQENGFTLLHICSQKGYADCIWSLLLHDADPSIQDLTKNKSTPFQISLNKSTKEKFRIFMNDFPLKYDYLSSKITSPISAEKLNEKKQKEKERRKANQKIKKQKEKETKIKNEQDKIEANEKKRFLEMNDDLKILSHLNNSRCFNCGMNITNTIPFCYLDFKFCSVNCLKLHRASASNPTIKNNT